MPDRFSSRLKHVTVSSVWVLASESPIAKLLLRQHCEPGVQQVPPKCSLHRALHLQCETIAGEKRRSREDAGTPEYKRQNSSGTSGVVRASHLLVKHRNVRRPSSWKEHTVTRSPVSSRPDLCSTIRRFRAPRILNVTTSIGRAFGSPKPHGVKSEQCGWWEHCLVQMRRVSGEEHVRARLGRDLICLQCCHG